MVVTYNIKKQYVKKQTCPFFKVMNNNLLNLQHPFYKYEIPTIYSAKSKKCCLICFKSSSFIL